MDYSGMKMKLVVYIDFGEREDMVIELMEWELCDMKPVDVGFQVVIEI